MWCAGGEEWFFATLSGVGGGGKWKNPRAAYAWDLGGALLRKAYAKQKRKKIMNGGKAIRLDAEAGFEPAIFGL